MPTNLTKNGHTIKAHEKCYEDRQEIIKEINALATIVQIKEAVHQWPSFATQANVVCNSSTMIASAIKEIIQEGF